MIASKENTDVSRRSGPSQPHDARGDAPHDALPISGQVEPKDGSIRPDQSPDEVRGHVSEPMS